MVKCTRFTYRLWDSITPVFRGILTHPFLKGLTSGRLSIDRFKEYVIQDSLYLRDFSKSLRILSLKAPREGWRKKFAEDSRVALDVEKALHESFFKHWHFRMDTFEKRRNPTNTAYSSYVLSSTATLPFSEGLSSVLPCYWIYLEVGRHLEKRGSPNALYQRWIDTYASEEFEAGVRSALDIMDTLRLSVNEKSNCVLRFRTAAMYEFMFWDAAYRFEKWKY